MARMTAIADAPTLRRLRAKEALYDELVDRLARAEDELETIRGHDAVGEHVGAVRYGGVWREIANDLAGALRPYSMFGEQTVKDGRAVVHTCVPAPVLRRAREALERLGREVARESYRAVGMAPVDEDEAAA